jgi:hypothetical protein
MNRKGMRAVVIKKMRKRMRPKSRIKTERRRSTTNVKVKDFAGIYSIGCTMGYKWTNQMSHHINVHRELDWASQGTERQETQMRTAGTRVVLSGQATLEQTQLQGH